MRILLRFLYALCATMTFAVSAQTLTIGTKLELNTLDPHFFASFPTGSSHELIYERLTALDERLVVQPQLSTAWRLIDAACVNSARIPCSSKCSASTSRRPAR